MVVDQKKPTRAALSENARQKTIDVVQQQAERLIKLVDKRVVGLPAPVKYRSEMKDFGRLVHLMKGIIQPRYLCRVERYADVTRAAERISRETGVSFNTVWALLFEMMRQYIRD